MKRKAVLTLLSNSLGELHFILPYLLKLKQEQSVDLYFYFINGKIFGKTTDDTFYHDLLVKHATILQPNHLLKFLLQHRKRVSLILKDTTALTENNIGIRIKNICTQASLVLFPHAYALLGYKSSPDQVKISTVEEKFVDKVLYVHPYDVPILKERYSAEKLLFVGAFGYSEWWAKQVGDYVAEHDYKLKINIPKNKIIVLLTLRDAHKIYLSEENLDYLLSSALEVLSEDQRYFIVVKPHPRQNVGSLLKKFDHFPSNRIMISNYNTFILAKYCHVNLSFWSSSVTDTLAMGIPSIEFHRFHTPFNQTIATREGLRSLYAYFNLTTGVTSKEELRAALPSDHSAIKALYEQQRQNFDQTFADISSGFLNFASLSSLASTRKASLTQRFSNFGYFFLKYIFRKFKPV